MKLHQLPNGSWIDPSTITAIRPLPTEREEGSGHLHRARVIVHHGSFGAEILTANDDEDAIRIANELAALVNK